MPKGGGSLQKLESAIVRITDLKTENEIETELFNEAKENVQAVIKKIDDPDLEYLLTERYLEDSSWHSIAEDLGFSDSYVFKLHRRALFLVAEKLDSTG